MNTLIPDVGLLGDGKERFSELRHGIEGISQRMLTLTLKELQRHGLIARTAYPAIPPRVQYEQNWEIGPAKIAKEFRGRGTNTTPRSPKMCKTFADPRAIAPVRADELTGNWGATA